MTGAPGRTATTTARDRLVDRARALALAVGTTGAADDTLSEVGAALDVLTDQLAARPGESVPAPAYADAVGAPTYHAARFNPALPPVPMTFQDGTCESRIRLGRLYEGPRGAVHGGVLSLLADNILASLVQHAGVLAVTASLTVDYRARTPLDEELLLHARVEEYGERKVTATGTISHAGRVTVQARGLFVRVEDR